MAKSSPGIASVGQQPNTGVWSFVLWGWQWHLFIWSQTNTFLFSCTLSSRFFDRCVIFIPLLFKETISGGRFKVKKCLESSWDYPQHDQNNVQLAFIGRYSLVYIYFENQIFKRHLHSNRWLLLLLKQQQDGIILVQLKWLKIKIHKIVDEWLLSLGLPALWTKLTTALVTEHKGSPGRGALCSPLISSPLLGNPTQGNQQTN